MTDDYNNNYNRDRNNSYKPREGGYNKSYGGGGGGNNNQVDSSKTQLFIAKGRNDGMDPRSLVAFISSEANISSSLISSVKVLDAFSFFAVPNEDAGALLDLFQQKAGEGRPLVSKARRKKSDGGGGFNSDDDF